MKFRALLGGTFLSILPALTAIPGMSWASTSTTKESKMAYFYTDNPTGDDETTEFLDASGQPVKAFEYRDAYEKESKDLQERASAAFGQAGGKGFGQEKLASAKIQTLNEKNFKNSSEQEKNKENPSIPPETISEVPQSLVNSETKANREVAVKKSETVSSKPKVLVS